MQPTIAILGAGHMGTSLLGGLLQDGYPAEKLWVTNTNAEKLAELSKLGNINCSSINTVAAAQADIIILAVKPTVCAQVAAEIKSIVSTKHPLILSIAAGLREESLRQWLGDHTAVVRAMPNTPALIGCGATALYANAHVSTTQHEQAESILRAVGTVIWLTDETLMDAVTALSGCGPAYFFLIMEAMEQAAMSLGLPQTSAHLLVLQTALGAARMAIESNLSLETLRHQVASRGGATEQALAVLEEKNIRGIFKNALQSAKQRSEELAALLGGPA